MYTQINVNRYAAQEKKQFDSEYFTLNDFRIDPPSPSTTIYHTKHKISELCFVECCIAKTLMNVATLNSFRWPLCANSRNKLVSNKSREAERLSYTSRAIVCEHHNTVSSSRDIGNDLDFPHLQASLCVCRSKIYIYQNPSMGLR